MNRLPKAQLATVLVQLFSAPFCVLWKNTGPSALLRASRNASVSSPPVGPDALAGALPMNGITCGRPSGWDSRSEARCDRLAKQGVPGDRGSATRQAFELSSIDICTLQETVGQDLTSAAGFRRSMVPEDP